MRFYPSLTGRLKIVSENPGFMENLERIILQLIRSKETEKLQQLIRDEIVPEMIKISPNLKDKINLDSLMEDVLGEDKNPDWQEIFSDSPGFIDKMEELSELQMEGADVFMESFAMLKSFPFYNELGNWFIPYFLENPEITEVLDISDDVIKRLLNAIVMAPVLCNSDKYSFSFSIQSIPRENRNFMEKAVQAEMEQIKELMDDEELTKPGQLDELASNRYIQDLYRFYKLFPRKSDFEDIFNWKLDFHNTLALGDILREHPQILRNIAEYYFAKNYFAEAAEIFEYLIEQKPNGELYQKIAYCWQQTGNFEKSLENYLKAELYEVNHLWNLKKIALCYRYLKQPDKALEYYQAAERLEPDDLNNQLNIGHCLLELHEYEEALKCYFKVEYLAPGNKKVWRPIAWCSFLTGKKEQAEKYLLQLLEDNPEKHDYMNMGHVQWSMGNRKEALDFYCKSVSQKGFTEEEFLEVFDEDLPHLIDQGINKDDVPIMLDQFRYFLEKQNSD
jgi:tetratricopeptide (TPR) repeat protein